MSPIVFTTLIGGSMIVTSVVWIFLVIITIREYRRGTDRARGAP